MAWNFVLSENELGKLAQDACETVLASASAYNHASVAGWNGKVITSLLYSLTQDVPKKNKYKFSVTSTIVQHDSSAAPGGDFADNAKRGMHSASGAFWDAKTDGMWSYKYNGGGKRGFDVVVSVLWVGI